MRRSHSNVNPYPPGLSREAEELRLATFVLCDIIAAPWLHAIGRLAGRWA
jgi:hypothetical protein